MVVVDGAVSCYPPTMAVPQALRDAARLEWARRSTVGTANLLPRPPTRPYRPARFHRALGVACDALIDDVLNQRGTWHAYGAPPRHGKTHHVGEATPTRLMLLRPGAQVLYATSTGDRVGDVSRAVRNAVEFLWREYGVAHLEPGEKWTAHEWETVGGNKWTAVSVGKSTGGIGANLVICDDTTGSAARARSRAFQRDQQRWLEEDILSRLMDGGCAMFMETRRGVMDQHAFITGKYPGKCEEYTWPLIADDTYLRDGCPDYDWRGPGEYLWPADDVSIRYGKEWHDQHPEVQGRLLAQLWQQRPTAESGGMLKRAWYDDRYTAHPSVQARSCTRLLFAIDNALSSGSGDWTRIQLWGQRGEEYSCIEQASGQWDIAEQAKQTKRMFAKWPNAKVRLIEDAPPGKALASVLRADGYAVTLQPHGGKSKAVRAEALAFASEAGRVKLPTDEHAPWVVGMIDEFCAFGPDCGHDDQVDAAAYAVAYFEGASMQRVTRSNRVGWGR